MPFHLIRRPLIAAALPAARQPGPVTLAIRDVRPDQPSSWPLLDRQIEEERRAIEALRRRIALGGALGAAPHPAGASSPASPPFRSSAAVWRLSVPLRPRLSR